MLPKISTHTDVDQLLITHELTHFTARRKYPGHLPDLLTPNLTEEIRNDRVDDPETLARKYRIPVYLVLKALTDTTEIDGIDNMLQQDPPIPISQIAATLDTTSSIVSKRAHKLGMGSYTDRRNKAMRQALDRGELSIPQIMRKYSTSLNTLQKLSPRKVTAQQVASQTPPILDALLELDNPPHSDSAIALAIELTEYQVRARRMRLHIPSYSKRVRNMPNPPIDTALRSSPPLSDDAIASQQKTTTAAVRARRIALGIPTFRERRAAAITAMLATSTLEETAAVHKTNIENIRHMMPAPPTSTTLAERQERNDNVRLDLLAGHPPEDVATLHGLPLAAVMLMQDSPTPATATATANKVAAMPRRKVVTSSKLKDNVTAALTREGYTPTGAQAIADEHSTTVGVVQSVARDMGLHNTYLAEIAEAERTRKANTHKRRKAVRDDIVTLLKQHIFNVAEIAEKLDTSPSTVYSLHKELDIPQQKKALDMRRQGLSPSVVFAATGLTDDEQAEVMRHAL